jgi:hypothetical protein
MSQWRTWSGILLLGGMMLFALGLCPHETRAMVAQSVILGLGGLGGFLAAKSYGEHRENARAATKAGEPAATVLAQGATG